MNHYHPLVSIIIPVYNRENIIKETVRCALDQTYQNIEIIICDNHSTDNTWRVLNEFALSDSRIKIYQNEVNLGPVLNWEKCLSNVSGEYTKVLWSDDLIENSFIEKTLPLLSDDTAFVITAYKVFNRSKENIIYESKYQNKSHYSTDQYLSDILIYDTKNFSNSPGCALFRTQDIKDAFISEIPNGDGLDFKKLGAGNDLMFFLLTTMKYKNIRCVKSFESYYRDHQGSMTSSQNLEIYYEWARMYFIYNFYQKLIPEYNTHLRYKSLRIKEIRTILSAINRSASWSFIFKKFLAKIKS